MNDLKMNDDITQANNTEKRAYRSPSLVEFGDVSRLTHAFIDGFGMRDNDTDKQLKEMS